MAATELTHPTVGCSRAPARARLPYQRRNALITALAAVWLLTAIGGLVGLLAPGSAPGGRPHPTLHGSVTDLLAILTTNLRLLSVPFALALLGFQHGRRARRFADLLVGSVVTGNCLRVGLAVGRYGVPLIPYIPQLPVEWLALALSTSAWITARHGSQPATLRARALQTVVAAAAAAAVETLLTPHAR